jgi:glycosyltransferase involved in cell wall biosynthesis
MELTVVMPCLNEANTLEACIAKAKGFIEKYGLAGEVLVADNGSEDGSQDIAIRNGARLISVNKRGYGAALIAGIHAAKGRYVVMGDSDDSYDFSKLELFLEQLRAGSDLVVGNRFSGGIDDGAMPFLHRYLGNPVLSWLGRRLFGIEIGDFHCGLRAFRRDAIIGLNLMSTGMEFASEMIIKASMRELTLTEVPTRLAQDGRGRPPHLRTWRDGWRHLKFMLVHAPDWLFIYPALVMLLVGLVGTSALLPGAVHWRGVVFDVHTLLFMSAFAVTGLQVLMFGLFLQVAGVSIGVLPENRMSKYLLHIFDMEYGVVLGAGLMGLGIYGGVSALSQWSSVHYANLNPVETMRLAIPAVTMAIGGLEIMMFSFVMTFMQMIRRPV